MSEGFEKKSGKKLKVALSVIVVLLIAVVVAGVLYLNSSRKPEKIFEKTIEEAFEMTEEDKAKTAKIELELSLEIDAEDPEVKAMNEIIKAVKVKSITETDLDKKILNENISITYNDEEVISLDGIVQDEAMYLYLKDIYSKYIEVDEEYYEGIEWSEVFALDAKLASEDFRKDIKQILLDEISERELTQEQVELNGEKVQKSTVKFTQKEFLEILAKILRKVNEYHPTEELEYAVEDFEAEIEYMEDTENYVDISIYTNGLTNNAVKTEIILADVEYGEVMVLEINNVSKDETTIEFSINEETAKVSGAEKIFEITINEEDKNNGTITFKMDVEDEGSIELKIKYNVEYNVNIEKRDVSNSVMMDELTEEDYNEMYLNIQENEILYSVIELLFGATGETTYNSEYVY